MQQTSPLDGLVITTDDGFLPGLGVGIVYAATCHLFFNHLRFVHPQIWEELGKPGLFAYSENVPKPRRGAYKFLRFLWSGKYRALNDLEVTFFIWALRVEMLLLVVVLLVPNGFIFT